jgi:hypothetical protein
MCTSLTHLFLNLAGRWSKTLLFYYFFKKGESIFYPTTRHVEESPPISDVCLELLASFFL